MKKLKNSIRRDYNNRLDYSNLELERLEYKILTNNRILPLVQRIKIKNSFSIERKGSRTLIRNKCMLTGRDRSVVKKYGLSRIMFRKLAESGLISGVRRASW